MLRIDYLMPADLFPSAFIGGLLLSGVSFWKKMLRKIIPVSFFGGVLALIAGQALAVVSGFASGETKPAGIVLYLVIFSLIIYTASLFAAGYGGILLVRRIFHTD